MFKINDEVLENYKKSNSRLIKLFLSGDQLIEYGSGLSTIAVIEKGHPIISMDSDKKILKKIKKHFSNDLENDKTHLIHRHIGFIKNWGYPRFFRPDNSTKGISYRHYSDSLLSNSSENNHKIIFIDGRFRVACALKLIDDLIPINDFTLIFDDFFDRTDYRTILNFFELEETLGDAAIFKSIKTTNIGRLRDTIKQYELIPN